MLRRDFGDFYSNLNCRNRLNGVGIGKIIAQSLLLTEFDFTGLSSSAHQSWNSHQLLPIAFCCSFDCNKCKSQVRWGSTQWSGSRQQCRVATTSKCWGRSTAGNQGVSGELNDNITGDFGWKSKINKTVKAPMKEIVKKLKTEMFFL